MPRERCDDWTQPRRVSSKSRSDSEQSSFVNACWAASLAFDLTGFLLRDGQPSESWSASGEKNGGLVTGRALVGRQRTV